MDPASNDPTDGKGPGFRDLICLIAGLFSVMLIAAAFIQGGLPWWKSAIAVAAIIGAAAAILATAKWAKTP